MNTSSRSQAFTAVEQLETRRLMSTVVALVGGKQLSYFDSGDPGTVLAKTTVKGLARGESLVGIDWRPSNGLLYGVGDSSRLYTIEPAGGRATLVGTGIGDGIGIVSARDADYGVDFNPAANLLRVVNDGDLNLRVNPDTGVAVDGDAAAPGVQGDLALAYAAGDPAAGANPSVVASAYTKNVVSPPNTSLYGIDSARDILVLQGSALGVPTSPNTGQLTTVGLLGVDTTDQVGFDVETIGNTDTALASLSTNAAARSGLYTINLTTGAATLLGEIGASRRPVSDIAIAPTGREVLVAARGNNFFTFDTALPHVVRQRVKVTGLARGEQIVAIDRRPANNVIYAATSQDRIYTVAPSGQATPVGGAPQTDVDLERGDYGFDFNPAVDRIRVVNERGQNLRVHPDTGAIVDADTVTAGVQIDGPLVFATSDANNGRTPHVVGAAYSSNTAGTTTTVLYDIDTTLDALLTQGTANGTVSPNTGQLFTVGPMGVNASDVLAFDIVTEGPTDTALAAMRVRGQPGLGLYSINLATGAATLIGRIGKANIALVGMTVLA